MQELLSINETDYDEIISTWEAKYPFEIGLKDVFVSENGIDALLILLNAYNEKEDYEKSISLIEGARSLLNLESIALFLNRDYISYLYLSLFNHFLSKKRFILAYFFLLESNKYYEFVKDRLLHVIVSKEELLQKKYFDHLYWPFIILYLVMIALSRLYDYKPMNSTLLHLFFLIVGIVIIALMLLKKMNVAIRKILIFFDIPRLYIHGRWGSGWL